MAATIFCKLRDIYRAIGEFEEQFQQANGLSLNEGMLLCTLSERGCLTSGEIAQCLELSNSNTSKVIRSVENKGYIKRGLGETDRRRMYFCLTQEGAGKLNAMQCERLNIPETLNSILAQSGIKQPKNNKL